MVHLVLCQGTLGPYAGGTLGPFLLLPSRALLCQSDTVYTHCETLISPFFFNVDTLSHHLEKLIVIRVVFFLLEIQYIVFEYMPWV